MVQLTTDESVSSRHGSSKLSVRGQISDSNSVPGVHLEEWSLLALFQAFGLGDQIVWLVLAKLHGLRLTVDVVLSQAFTLDRFLHGGEVGDLWGALRAGQLNVVALQLCAAGSRNVQLDLGENGLLDVGDGSWLVLANNDRRDNSSLQVDQEGLHQVALELLGEGLDLDRFGLLLPHDTSSLREPDILAIDGPEFWFGHPEAQ